MVPTQEFSETESTRGAYGEEGSLEVGEPLVGDDNPYGISIVSIQLDDILATTLHTVMLYLLLELDELLDAEGRAGGGMLFSPLLEVARLDKDGCREDGLVEASKRESRVEEDFVFGPEALEPSESLDDFSVLKLALDRLLSSLKKGIVAANSSSRIRAAIQLQAGKGGYGKREERGEKRSRLRLRLMLRHDKRTLAEHVWDLGMGMGMGMGTGSTRGRNDRQE